MKFTEPVGQWRALRLILGEKGKVEAKAHCKLIKGKKGRQRIAVRDLERLVKL